MNFQDAELSEPMKILSVFAFSATCLEKGMFIWNIYVYTCHLYLNKNYDRKICEIISYIKHATKLFCSESVDVTEKGKRNKGEYLK